MEDDQERFLEEAATVVREQAYYMKQNLDKNSLREALKHSSNMLCELRTSLLSPKNYFSLCKLFSHYMYRYDRVR
jgi:vacuolar protein sorting-associated protein 35